MDAATPSLLPKTVSWNTVIGYGPLVLSLVRATDSCMNTLPRESYHVNRIKHRLAYASYLGDFRYRTILLLVRTMGDYRVQLYVLVQGLYDSS